MSKCEKLRQKAKRSPGGLRFMEICYLAECFGFIFTRQEGSHRLYKREGYPKTMNFQDVKGKAKEYQVQQLLAAIEGLETLEGEEDEDN